MEKLDQKLYEQLEALDRDRLFEILKKAGITFTEVDRAEISKEDLLLVADEADSDLLQVLIKKQPELE